MQFWIKRLLDNLTHKWYFHTDPDYRLRSLARDYAYHVKAGDLLDVCATRLWQDDRVSIQYYEAKNAIYTALIYME